MKRPMLPEKLFAKVRAEAERAGVECVEIGDHWAYIGCRLDSCNWCDAELMPGESYYEWLYPLLMDRWLFDNEDGPPEIMDSDANVLDEDGNIIDDGSEGWPWWELNPVILE